MFNWKIVKDANISTKLQRVIESYTHAHRYIIKLLIVKLCNMYVLNDLNNFNFFFSMAELQFTGRLHEETLKSWKCL